MTTKLGRWLEQMTSRTAAPYDATFQGHARRPRVLIFTEHLNATYYISFDLPLRNLHRLGLINVAVLSQQTVSAKGPHAWAAAADDFQPDLVVFSRYGLPFGPEMMAGFQARGIPVIYHLDDDLLEVPKELGEEISQRQGNPDVVDARRLLMQRCDLIYASTAQLADRLQPRFPAQRIVHGIYAPYLKQEPAPAPTQSVIGYMGSKGHQQDLDLAVPALGRLLEERPALRFETFGTIGMPTPLRQFGNRVSHHRVQTSYREFLKTLAGLGWTVGLAPLSDTPFNRCKAPTKFVEYSACGIPVLASDLPVYSSTMPPQGGLLVAQDWYGAMTRMLDDHTFRVSAVRAAREHCSTSFALSKLEDQLLTIFDNVTSIKRSPHACR